MARVLQMDDLLDLLREGGSRRERQEAIDRVCAAGGLCVSEGKSTTGRIELQDVALAGLDLSGLWLGAVRMTRVDLRGALCCGTCFSQLDDCLLDHVVANGSRFPALIRCSAHGADLRHGSIGSRSRRTDFRGATLAGAQLLAIAKRRRGFWRCSFDDADLSGVDALGVRFHNTSFERARLIGSRLARAEFVGCRMSGGDWSEANLLRTTFTGVDCAGANLHGCLVEGERAIAGGGPHAGAVRVAPRPTGPATAELARALAAVEKYWIEWGVRGDNPLVADKLALMRQPGEGPRGYAFDARSRNCRRMYAEGLTTAGEASAILADFAIDYVQWQADPASVNVRGLRVENVDLVELTRAMLRELFP